MSDRQPQCSRRLKFCTRRSLSKNIEETSRKICIVVRVVKSEVLEGKTSSDLVNNTGVSNKPGKGCFVASYGVCARCRPRVFSAWNCEITLRFESSTARELVNFCNICRVFVGPDGSTARRARILVSLNCESLSV